MRRLFILPPPVARDLSFSVSHRGPVEVYVNGAEAAKLSGSSDGYVNVPLASEARAALREGLNVLAVHAQATEPDPFIDLGIHAPPQTEQRE